MQVRSVGADGRVWLDSDSFLPLTLVGNDVTLFSEVSLDTIGTPPHRVVWERRG
jgi:hypothetical protein